MHHRQTILWFSIYDILRPLFLILDMDPASMFMEKNRLKSFESNWKVLKGFKHCTPENFSKAGFYNVSTKESPDSVKCFVCGKELDGWEKGDDPWKEHIKRGEKCLFVQLRVKSPDGGFKVEDVLQLYYEMMRNIIIETHTKQINVLEHALELIKGVKNGNLDVLEKEAS